MGETSRNSVMNPGDKIFAIPQNFGNSGVHHKNLELGKRYPAVYRGKARFHSRFHNHGETFDLDTDATSFPHNRLTGYVTIGSPSLAGGDWKLIPQIEKKYDTKTWKMPR